MEGFERDLRNRLAELYHSGRWICVGMIPSVATRLLDQVATAAGFEPPATDDERRSSPLIGLTIHGVDPESDTGFPVLSLDRPSSGDLLTDTLGMASALGDPPSSVLDELDAWDPDRTGRFLIPPIVPGRPIARREVFGGRPSAWAALEDKLAILDVFADAGLITAPAEVVDLDEGRAAVDTHRRLAGPHGSVWAVDNSNGMHGGAAGTHIVGSEPEAIELALRLAGDHERIRIMPFLNGVPCSIHGVVLDEVTVTGRPNEMLMYVDETNPRFHYCRFANHWDPPPADREAMTAAAVAVGDTLRVLVDFRGVFSLDGVLTTDGFRPTEINPRYGMALPFELSLADGEKVNVMLLDKAIIAGAVSPDPELLQRWLIRALDENRDGGAMFPTVNRPDKPRSGAVLDDDGTLTLVPDDGDETDAAALASVIWRPLGDDQRLILEFGDAFPVGPPAAPLALRIARAVDDEWDLGLPALTPAFSLGGLR